MLQRWRKLTFLHWRYAPEAIESLIPKPLVLDTLDGVAWLGLVPFEVCDLRPRWMPSAPWIAHFPETNIRTYVRGRDGERGVWFFTLEAARFLAVWGARAFFHLPYRWAAMKLISADASVYYWSRRKRSFGTGMTDIVVEPGQPIKAGVLENFLTARFRLYSNAGKNVYTLPIEHAPWPLQSATVVRLNENLFRNTSLPEPGGVPVIQYSADLTVKIGQITKIV